MSNQFSVQSIFNSQTADNNSAAAAVSTGEEGQVKVAGGYFLHSSRLQNVLTHHLVGDRPAVYIREHDGVCHAQAVQISKMAAVTESKIYAHKDSILFYGYITNRRL